MSGWPGCGVPRVAPTPSPLSLPSLPFLFPSPPSVGLFVPLTRASTLLVKQIQFVSACIVHVVFLVPRSSKNLTLQNCCPIFFSFLSVQTHDQEYILVPFWNCI